MNQAESARVRDVAVTVNLIFFPPHPGRAMADTIKYMAGAAALYAISTQPPFRNIGFISATRGAADVALLHLYKTAAGTGRCARPAHRRAHAYMPSEGGRQECMGRARGLLTGFACCLTTCNDFAANCGPRLFSWTRRCRVSWVQGGVVQLNNPLLDGCAGALYHGYIRAH